MSFDEISDNPDSHQNSGGPPADALSATPYRPLRTSASDRQQLARGFAIAALIVSIIVATCIFWLPIVTTVTIAAGTQPRHPMIDENDTVAHAGEIALAAPVVLAALLLRLVWLGKRLLAVILAIALIIWGFGFFVTLLVGLLVLPTSGLALLAALLLPKPSETR